MITKWSITIPELTGEEPRSAYVYVPDAFEEDPEARYPVLYMFDGHNVFFDEDATYGKSWGMADLKLLKGPEKVIVFYRKGLLFAFNFDPSRSLTNVLVPVATDAEYTLELSTDDSKYGGQDLVANIPYPTKQFDGQPYVELYLPARTAIVLKERPVRKSPKKGKTQ